MLEFGCGYGTFTIPTAQQIIGRLFALDIEPEMIAVTAQKAAMAGLKNVIANVCDFTEVGCGRPDASVDYAMLFNILHVENPVSLLQETHRALIPGGKVGVIHWRSDLQTPRGPSMPIRPTPEQCKAWGEEAGLEFVRYEQLCCCSWHWGLVMRRPARAASIAGLPEITKVPSTSGHSE